MNEIEKKLNIEYKNIGTISIQELHESVIDISKIEYVNSIMDKILPLESDEPVILGKKYNDNYVIIDGYHRIKDKLLKKDTNINAYILDKYSIKRETDTLFGFLEKLVGKNIKFIDSNLFIVDNIHYQIKENEGCGGCSSGWSSIEVLPEFIDKTINIKKIESIGKYDSDEYDLVINGKKIAKVDTGYGNGYYGGDFEIKLIN